MVHRETHRESLGEICREESDFLRILDSLGVAAILTRTPSC